MNQQARLKFLSRQGRKIRLKGSRGHASAARRAVRLVRTVFPEGGGSW